MTIQQVAQVCHEINRTFCKGIGDTSQVSWEEAPEWQKDSAIAGVLFRMQNPDAPDSATHDNWMAQKVAEGWIYGAKKDTELKTHPCLLPYDALPNEQKIKDMLFGQVVKSLSPFIV